MFSPPTKPSRTLHLCVTSLGRNHHTNEVLCEHIWASPISLSVTHLVAVGGFFSSSGLRFVSHEQTQSFFKAVTKNHVASKCKCRRGATTVCFLLRLFTSDKLFHLQRVGQLTDVLGGLLKDGIFFLSPFFSLSLTAGGSFRCFCQMTMCHNQGCPSAPLNSNPSHAPTRHVRSFLLSLPSWQLLIRRQGIERSSPSPLPSPVFTSSRIIILSLVLPLYELRGGRGSLYGCAGACLCGRNERVALVK